MASHGREIRHIAFACDTSFTELDIRGKFLRECETVHTPPNSRRRPDSTELPPGSDHHPHIVFGLVLKVFAVFGSPNTPATRTAPQAASGDQGATGLPQSPIALSRHRAAGGQRAASFCFGRHGPDRRLADAVGPRIMPFGRTGRSTV
jgi:hypothetical protein